MLKWFYRTFLISLIFSNPARSVWSVPSISEAVLAQGYKTPLVWSWNSFFSIYESQLNRQFYAFAYPVLCQIPIILKVKFFANILYWRRIIGNALSWIFPTVWFAQKGISVLILCGNSAWEFCVWLLNGFCIVILCRNS